ncbi:MAG: head GIN domain-containing protein [Telluria sp.]
MKTTLKTTLGLRHAVLAVAAFALAAPAATVAASPLDWIGGEKIKGSGKVMQQNRALANFSGVALSLPARVELRIGNTEGVSVETDDNLLPLVETVIENGTLKVRPSKRNMNLQPTHMRVVIQARSVERLSVGGSGTIHSQPLRGGKMVFDIGGSGSIEVDRIDGDSVSVSLGGSGDLTTGGGSAKNLSVSVAGSGDVDVGKVAAGQASVTVAGSGTATVWARDSLGATIAGSGDVNYYGNPKITRSVVGSGDVVRLGNAPR